MRPIRSPFAAVALALAFGNAIPIARLSRRPVKKDGGSSAKTKNLTREQQRRLRQAGKRS